MNLVFCKDAMGFTIGSYLPMIKTPRHTMMDRTEKFYALEPASSAATPDPSFSAARLVAAFLAGRKPETIKAYRADLEDFQAFVRAPTLDQAASLLLARGQGEANALVLAYRTHLMDRGWLPFRSTAV